MTAKSNAREGDGVAENLLLQAIARGWCAPENAGKVTDPSLAFAIEKEVRAYLSAMQAQQGAEPVAWQSIETAPKDGTNVLLWIEYGEAPVVGRYDGDSWCVDTEHHGVSCGSFCYGGSPTTARYFKPTHWQPLPAAPATGAPR